MRGKTTFFCYLVCLLCITSTNLFAQVTTNGGSGLATTYPTLASAITALNGATINSPVVITLTGNETAPAGGYSITASGTSTNTITIQGSSSTITAFAGQTSGNLTDAIFKLIGADWITIKDFTMQENSANTTTTAASNNMTEWGVALLYASTTNGAQNNTIHNNVITLNRSYQNTFGIYANATHSATAPTTSATATTGNNSGLRITSNSISNINFGIIVIGPTAAADHNDGIIIGGNASNANTITNYGTTSTFSSYANVSGTVNGVLVRNSKNFTISHNTITSSNGGTTSGTLRGIFIPSFTNAPTGTITNVINNNTISVTTGVAAGTLQGIVVETTTGNLTTTLNIDNNNFTNCGYNIANPTGAFTAISDAMANLTTTISNNTFTNLSISSTGAVIFISHGFSIPSTGILTISGNSIVTAFTRTAAGAITLTTSNSTSGTGSINNYTNNNFSNIIVPDNASSTITGFNNTDGGTGSTKTITGNTFSNWHGGTSGSTGTTGAINVMNFTYWNGISSLSNNTISNITGRSTITGVTIGSSANNATSLSIQNNTISNLNSIGTGGNVTGITCSNTSTAITISNNNISNLSSSGVSSTVVGVTIAGATNTSVSSNIIHTLSGSGTTSPIVNGISVSAGTTVNVFKNKIYGLSQSGAISTTVGAVNGMQFSGGTTVNAYNNLIGNLTAPAANLADAIRGISITSTTTSTTYRVYYNTVYLNASSTGINFGTTGVFHTASSTASTATLDLRNNIIINLSTPAGTGVTAVLRRSAAATYGNWATTSNRNLLFAGTPGTTRVILADGATNYQNFGTASTAGTYRNVVGVRDANSIPGENFMYDAAGAFFISLTGSSNYFLRLVEGITSQTESGASPITDPAITDDYDGTTRNSTNPDIGADEFTGITPAPSVTISNITPSTTQCTATARTVTATVTANGAAINNVKLRYQVNGGTATEINMTNTSGNIWEGIIPVVSPGNGLVTWSVIATDDNSLSTSIGGTSYSDEPLTGVTASINRSASTICASGSSTLTASLVKSGSVQLGAGASTSSSVGSSFLPGSWGGAKSQFLIRASELTALGLTAGPITALGYYPTTSGQTYQGFAVSIGHTALTSMTTDFISSGLTQVFAGTGTNNGYTPTANVVNTLAFGTGGTSSSFNWDGTSNIVIQICWSVVPAAGTSTASTMRIDATGFNSTVSKQLDSQTPENMCSTGSGSVYTNRPQFFLTAVPTITSVSWSDGLNTIGTSNPITVNPTQTTNYSAIVTALGCTINATSVQVTVNPLPTPPVGTNSNQCGTKVPEASVSDPNGFTTPSFKWYTAASGGTAIQSSTATTFANQVSTDTTFYVSVTNPTTGCESERTAVSVSIAPPPALTIDSSSFAICSGIASGKVNVTSTKSNFDSYTWSPSNGVSGDVDNGWTFNTAATTTYTLTSANSTSGCQNTVNLTVTVNANPVVTTASATPATICTGVSTSLTASSVSPLSGSYPIGTGSNTSALNTDGTPFRVGNTVGNQFKNQYLWLASELQAAGLVAGKITSLRLNVAGSGGGTVSNLVIKIGSTNQNSMTTTYITGLTTVLTMATYPSTGTLTTGAQNFTFSTPFDWNGTSNIVIEICSQLATSGTAGTLSGDATSFASTIMHLASTTGCSSTTGASTSTIRPNVVFGFLLDQTSDYSWSWTPGTLTGTSLTVNPPTTTTYTARATNATTGCFGEKNVVVTVNPLPTPPLGTNSSQCGTKVPEASVSDPNGFTTPSFKWYTAASGGTAIQSSTATTFANQVSTDTTFYVSVTNPTTGCESERTAVSVSIAPPPALTIDSSSFAICSGIASGKVNVTSTKSNFDSYTWSPSNGISGDVDNGWTFNPATTTTYTLTSANSVSGCQNTVNLTVTVNANPVVTTASATPATICTGANVSLRAGAFATSASIGTGTSLTGATAQPSAFVNRWPSYRSQSVYTAAELLAAGVTAGSITSMAYNITTLGDAGSNSGFTVRIGTAAGSTITSTTWQSTVGFTTVYGPADYTHTASGLQTITFTTPYVWDGTSNILIDVVMNGADASNNSQTYFTTTTGNTMLHSGSSGSAAATGTLTNQRLNLVFQSLPNTASSLNWTWSPGSLSGINVTASPNSTTTYTARATNVSTGCFGERTVTVTVNNPINTAPTTGTYVYGAVNNTGYATAANWYLYNGTNYEIASSAPTATSNVIIPATGTCVLANPVLSTATTVNNLEIQTGATLGLSGQTLTINGTVTGSGTLTGSSSSNVEIGGTGALGTLNFTQTTDGTTNTLQSLTLNRSGGSATIGNKLVITNVLTATAGTLNTGGFLHLRSTASGTARVAPVGGDISGNVTVERFIPATAGRAWRLLAAPLSATGAPTIKDAWQEGVNNTTTTFSSNQNPNPGYGTHITLSGGSANGFDESNGSASIKYFNGTTLPSPSNTNTTKVTDNGGAYFVFIRGNRGLDVTNLSSVGSTTLRMRGALNIGNVTTGIAGTGTLNFSLIPNPYASAVDFEKIRSGNGSSINSFYIYDANIKNYRLIDRTNVDEYNSTPFIDDQGTLGTATNENAARFIQSGQAFWVPGQQQLNFTENMKTDGVPVINAFKTNGTEQQMIVNLKVNNNGTFTLIDGIRVRYNTGFSKQVLPTEDYAKFAGFNENMAVLREAQSLTIERRPFITDNDTIFLRLWNTGTKAYQFELQPINIDPTLSAFIEDAYLNTSMPIDITAPSTVLFNVDLSVPASAAQNRFRIVFKTGSTLPITKLLINATQKDNRVQVDYTALGESGMEGYEVERSINGIEFTKMAVQKALGNNNGTMKYGWIDENPVNGDNFYRIKAIDKSGKIQFSNIAKVKMNSGKQEIFVYPNPVKGEIITLHMNKAKAGTYTVRMFNTIGQEMYNGQVQYDGGSATRTLHIPALSIKGTYSIQISNGETTINQTIISQ